jgi:hypothetical protein
MALLPPLLPLLPLLLQLAVVLVPAPAIRSSSPPNVGIACVDGSAAARRVATPAAAGTAVVETSPHSAHTRAVNRPSARQMLPLPLLLLLLLLAISLQKLMVDLRRVATSAAEGNTNTAATHRRSVAHVLVLVLVLIVKLLQLLQLLELLELLE